MKETRRFTGKNMDIAIESALAALGMDRDIVEVDLIAREKPGFLGFGASPCVIEVSYEVPDPVEPVKSALGSASRSKPKAKKPVEAPKAEEKKPEVKAEPKKEEPKAEAPKTERKPEATKAEQKPAEKPEVNDDLAYLDALSVAINIVRAVKSTEDVEECIKKVCDIFIAHANEKED